MSTERDSTSALPRGLPPSHAPPSPLRRRRRHAVQCLQTRLAGHVEHRRRLDGDLEKAAHEARVVVDGRVARCCSPSSQPLATSWGGAAWHEHRRSIPRRGDWGCRPRCHPLPYPCRSRVMQSSPSPTPRVVQSSPFRTAPPPSPFCTAPVPCSRLRPPMSCCPRPPALVSFC